jgi:hypothetical protein
MQLCAESLLILDLHGARLGKVRPLRQALHVLVAAVQYDGDKVASDEGCSRRRRPGEGAGSRHELAASDGAEEISGCDEAPMWGPLG